MRKFVVAAEAAGAITAAAVSLAATAAANSSDDADGVVSSLKSQGYNVQIVPARASLAGCSVVGIHPSNLDQSASLQEKQHTLVEVVVACPPN